MKLAVWLLLTACVLYFTQCAALHDDLTPVELSSEKKGEDQFAHLLDNIAHTSVTKFLEADASVPQKKALAEQSPSLGESKSSGDARVPLKKSHAVSKQTTSGNADVKKPKSSGDGSTPQKKARVGPKQTPSGNADMLEKAKQSGIITDVNEEAARRLDDMFEKAKSSGAVSFPQKKASAVTKQAPGNVDDTLEKAQSSGIVNKANEEAARRLEAETAKQEAAYNKYKAKIGMEERNSDLGEGNDLTVSGSPNKVSAKRVKRAQKRAEDAQQAAKQTANKLNAMQVKQLKSHHQPIPKKFVLHKPHTSEIPYIHAKDAIMAAEKKKKQEAKKDKDAKEVKQHTAAPGTPPAAEKTDEKQDPAASATPPATPTTEKTHEMQDTAAPATPPVAPTTKKKDEKQDTKQEKSRFMSIIEKDTAAPAAPPATPGIEKTDEKQDPAAAATPPAISATEKTAPPATSATDKTDEKQPAASATTPPATEKKYQVEDKQPSVSDVVKAAESAAVKHAVKKVQDDSTHAKPKAHDMQLGANHPWEPNSKLPKLSQVEQSAESAAVKSVLGIRPH